MAKILLIEDDAMLRKSIAEIFADRLYQIFQAVDGASGLKLAKQEAFDLIILDLMLPKLSGFLVTKGIRSAGIETPILIISTKRQLSDLMTALDFGADGYLYKPFNLNELICRAESILKRPPHSCNRAIKIGPLNYNADLYKATLNGKPLKLQRKQLEILHYFMNHPERIIRKDELINSLWKYDAKIKPSTVDVHVNIIRKALESYKSGPKLISSHGFGVRLVRKS